MKDNLILRDVKKNDIKDVYDLSNQDYVRQYAINVEKIKWEDHIKWFDSVINDENIVFYVVSNDKLQFLGLIRYSLEDDEATVTIHFTEKLKGKGHAVELLNEANNKLFTSNHRVNKIVAFVHPNNTPSKRIFAKLNFKLEDEGEFNRLILKREKI